MKIASRFVLTFAALAAFAACSDSKPGSGDPECTLDLECDSGFCDPDTNRCAPSDTGLVDADADDVSDDATPDVADASDVDAADTTDTSDADDVDTGDVDAGDVDADDADAGDTDAGDTGDTDVDATDTDTDTDVVECVGEECCTLGERNACGGCAVLELDGTESVPGDTCGTCGGGYAVCNGPNALRCVDPTPTNECDSCAVLPGPIDGACGVCGNGALLCDDTSPQGMVCDGAFTNGCGGCVPLGSTPGTDCTTDGDEDGMWVCVGADGIACDTDATNVCGGDGDLLYMGAPAAPGDPCGPALDGALFCDGTELACSVDDTENACGGIAVLAGTPGESCSATSACGAVDATWTCATPEVAESLGISPFDGVVCIPDGPRPENACGGCTDLEGTPGDACGDDGRWACSGADAVFCLETGACEGDVNACGGCETLDDAPSDTCGTCDSGFFVCEGPDTIGCAGDLGDDALNDCGACGELTFDGRPAGAGDACGACGTGALLCDGEELTCEGDGGVDATNLCGGCADLDGDPGADCGSCGSGTWRCAVGGESVVCLNDAGGEAENACGGCDTLPGAPGEACGVCGSGVYACDGAGGLECVGDAGDGALNACGGCTELVGNIGDACGTCDSGALACAGDNESFVCAGDLEGEALNECGGCAELAGEPDESCGACGDGTWTCSGDGEAVTCEGAELAPNSCGGCAELDGTLGAPCGECGGGTLACNGPVALRCSDETELNACENCAAIDDVEPGDSCGTCDNGSWICREDGIECFGHMPNACGGCAELSETPGEECDGGAGTYVCTSTESVSCTAGDLNACGGTSTLTYDGSAASPGDRCGRRNEGNLVCDGTDALTCTVEDGPNACGGDVVLAGEPGDLCVRPTACGDVTGVWNCATEEILGENAFDGVVCLSTAPDTNACGGCTSLSDEPGTLCGDDGVFQCTGPDSVECSDAVDPCDGGFVNACGGCGALPSTPGDACGTCGTGTLACASRTEVTCIGDQGDSAINACGGCDPLFFNVIPAEPGDGCGTCGEGALECDTINRLVCNDDDVETNVCGGCEELTETPGTSCGTCGSGTWQCGPGGDLVCAGDLGDGALNECGGCGEDPFNACGGCAALSNSPGSPCGTCQTGTYTCNGDGSAVTCEGDEGSAALNECGGCVDFGSDFGAPCGVCDTGNFVCAGPESLRCGGDQGGDAINSCGGCGDLANEPGGSCGTCGLGTYTCDGNDATVCSGDPGSSALNACGGCGTLSETVGADCGTCGSGTVVCDGEEATTCSGDLGASALNGCGGCSGLANEPGESCGTCGNGAYECSSPDSTTCVGATTNACGGCTDLADDLGASCGTCGTGTFTCNGTEALTCSGDQGSSALNDCGGCSDLSNDVGDSCGTCGSGSYICDGAEGVTCNGDEGSAALNECGGCTELANEVGDVCGVCETEVWACNGTDALTCDTSIACPTCDDGIRNQDESDVDCGGDTCDPCGQDEMCGDNADCDSGLTCDGGTCQAPPACDDNRMNGTETDIDCGGDTCDPCATAEMCGDNGDCRSNATCNGGICEPRLLVNPWVAFVANEFGLPGIYLVRLDGTGLTRMSIAGEFLQNYPAFSPDGERLAYTAVTGTGLELRIVTLATGVVESINHGLTDMSGLTWAPNGLSIMVESSGAGGANDLYVIPLDGSGAVASPATSGRGEAEPRWMRRDQVWYVVNVSGFDIWTRTLSTGADARQTTGSSILGGADIAWDFSWMIYRRRTGADSGQLVRRNSSGSVINLGSNLASAGAMSPDGTFVLYVEVDGDGQSDIVMADVTTGATLRQITDDEATETSISISSAESGPLWLLTP